MLVPNARMDEAAAIAKAAAEQVKVGDPNAEGTTIGPVVSTVQFNKIQFDSAGDRRRRQAGNRRYWTPGWFEAGYYVKPTVFSHVTNDMTISREEIFGPVLAMIGYEDDEDAVRIANDTLYGLSGYISSEDPERAKK